MIGRVKLQGETGALGFGVADGVEAGDLGARIFDADEVGEHAQDSGGKLGEPAIRAAAEEGDVSFFAEALGELAGVSGDDAW